MTRERLVQPMGDGAVRWQRDVDRDAAGLLELLRAQPGVIDAVVTESHAMVTFDPARPPDAPWLVEDSAPRAIQSGSGREHVLRARYDGPDLAEIAARVSLSPRDVVRAHTRGPYVVRFLGFLPGFAYLGPIAPELVVPRRTTPRTRVEAGSVGLAGAYTGVYPCASPGGWNLLGHVVDFTSFDVARGARLALGDRVRFEAVP
jgi:UPF0271 protein